MLRKALFAVGLCPEPADAEAQLAALGVPCAACGACDSHTPLEGLAAEDSFLRAWKAQSIDSTSQVLGATKPFLRQGIISTGREDWPNDVASVKGSIAQLLTHSAHRHPPASGVAKGGIWTSEADARSAPGGATRLMVQNGSFHSTAAEGEETLLLFPDWVLITPLPTAPAAEAQATIDEVYDNLLLPSDPTSRGGVGSVTRRVLPYAAVILVCSHKRRDARCHISAKPLKDSFTRAAHRSGWEVDERGDELPHPGSFLELGRDEELRQRREASQSKTLGLFSISHIGGHKFAGNVIIYFPNGAGVWYARIDPAAPGAVEQVWTATVLGGKILAPYLRAGINLQHGQKVVSGSDSEMRGIYEW